MGLKLGSTGCDQQDPAGMRKGHCTRCAQNDTAFDARSGRGSRRQSLPKSLETLKLDLQWQAQTYSDGLRLERGGECAWPHPFDPFEVYGTGRHEPHTGGTRLARASSEPYPGPFGLPHNRQRQSVHMCSISSCFVFLHTVAL